MTKDAKRYYREIKTLLPSKCDCGKSVLESIKMRIMEIECATPKVTYDELCDTLGEPKTVISDYYSIVDVDYLVKKLRFSKRVRICSYLALVTVIACFFTVAAYYHQAYITANNAIIQLSKQEIINE
ncbi:MAG: hypothetical protein HFH14_08405 [Lachnospiraceae bacterium]|nr:hypothetical protein [Lachnospiraceae bacterium]